MSAGRPSQLELPVPARVRAGLDTLLQAYRYAAALGRDAWDFAVEIRALKNAGLTLSDLRWLVCMGYVDHGREVSDLGAMSRDFQCHGGLVFSRRSAFVLTPAGLRTAESPPRTHEARLDERDQPFALADWVAALSTQDLPPIRQPAIVEPAPEPASPHWDSDRHELRVGPRLVKVFKLPSPNQEIVLTAFEEEGWPARIDDPLPPAPDLEPKRRLHDTIKSLNRNQKHRLLRFMGDGTGQGIQWSLTDPAESTNGPLPR